MRIIFLHHSTGADLIKYGQVRPMFKKLAPSVEFWDHGYDDEQIRGFSRLSAPFQRHIYGLRDATGAKQPYSFHVPRQNTDPDGLSEIFSQSAVRPPANAFSYLLEFDTIVFKSCFPVTAIRSDEQLETYKQYYRTIRSRSDEHPSHLFIPMTPPPLRASLTNRAQARRARAFSRWMMSFDFHGGRKNLVPYDFFDALATPESDPLPNVLQPQFCRWIWIDSHPNASANRTVAPLWVEAILTAIARFTNAPLTGRYSSGRGFERL
jgi:hypothetical protein